ncbi:FAD:protein FMN transferase [Peptoniphilus catoniae]|uniref:FAD:protein FMN transferase n=1 Tax=Peptoniphilus catoniae TaxID=1660341 RepID=UPI0010FE8645|nr:FAD:protein FMN transferase [Peptoniphilus catoniae]
MKRLLPILALSFLLVACGTRVKEKSYDISFFDAFDTYTVISIYDKDDKSAPEKLNKLKDKFFYYHRLYDRFNSYDNNNLKTINDNAGKTGVKVEEDLYDLIKRSLEIDSNIQKVNIAIGPVTDLWNEYSQLYQDGKTPEEVKNIMGSELPKKEDLEALRPLIDENNIELNDKERSVYLKKEGMALDLGSVAKGYAVEKLAQYAEKELGVKAGVISAGGNVRTIGSPPDKKSFKIAITMPDDIIERGGSEYLAVLDVNDKSVVTSGDYRRFFIYKGARYPHIIDEETLAPSNDYRSVSIIVKDSFVADYLSTAMYLSDYQSILDTVKEYDAEVIILMPDLKVLTSPGLEAIGEVNEK